jgi:restriction endonuclease BglII
MRIVEQYSHLNGWEHIQVHKPQVWQEIIDVISHIDAEACRTKESRERGIVGRMLFSPGHLNRRFHEEFDVRGWHESRTSYWVTSDVQLIRKTVSLPAAEQRREIIAAGKTPIASYNQTDFVKDRIAVEVQFGKYSFVAYDLFVKHMAFYVGDIIDVGVEILPMKEMSSQMSSGISSYEGELYNVIRQGRSVPAVPLVLVGVAP